MPDSPHYLLLLTKFQNSWVVWCSSSLPLVTCYLSLVTAVSAAIHYSLFTIYYSLFCSDFQNGLTCSTTFSMILSTEGSALEARVEISASD